ncbi:MAG TPA: VWA domain-containing protein [Hyphomonadaceae bacterium]|nr:VWA domain-containing protein [Hyphomonadaceae bacterium]HPN05896.1 VWA domain-containing protein [Hyphomonadaceae bacterium]
MTRFQTGFLFAASALTLAACASPTGSEVSGGTVKVGQSDGRDGVVVTAQRRESSVQDVAVPVQAITQEQAYAPPAPPPPPVGMPAPMGKMDTYAQVMPQPMPGDVNRDKYQDVQINGVKLVAQEPVSTFSIDVDTASYSNVRRMLNAGHLPPKDAVRIEELINYFDYDYALPKSKNTPFETTVKVVPSPWAEGRQLMHVAVQGYDINRDARPPLNLTLLIDVSGSMSAQNKLPLAIQSLKLLINEMTAKDTIAIAVYAGAAGTVLEPTSGADKAKIMAALDKLSAGGSTAGGEGLRLAYNLAKQNFSKNSVNRVMLLSDGDFNVGINDPNALEDFVSRERESGVYLSILGFGGGNYNDLLMQKLAQSGNGMAAYIDTLNEGRKVLNDDLSGSMFSIADDVKIQVEFNPAKVAEYRLIGYETRILNREDFNNDKVDAGEIGAGSSVTAIYEITPVGSKATLIDPSRYKEAAKPAGNSNEFAFLKLRYKMPGESKSKLVDRPITVADQVTDISKAPEATRFATAVAGYGSLLRGDPYLDKSFTWDRVIDLANGAKGSDAFGYRAEFVQLARLAKTAATQESLKTPGAGEVGQ